MWSADGGCPGSVIPEGQWVHIAGISDGERLRTFVNGQEASCSKRPFRGEMSKYGGTVAFGGNPHWKDRRFRGDVGNVMVWQDLALSGEQLSAIVAKTRPKINK